MTANPNSSPSNKAKSVAAFGRIPLRLVNLLESSLGHRAADGEFQIKQTILKNHQNALN
jgi:hypothetical protein